MSYITLTPHMFQDDTGTPSMEYFSQYCQLPTTKKFIYTGDIYGDYYDNLIFPNIVKVNGIYTKDIANQFPDLEHAKSISYYVQGIPDIGNLKSVDSLYMNCSHIFDKEKRSPVFNDYIKVMDDETLKINDKKLKVNYHWSVGPAFYYSKCSKEWNHGYIDAQHYKICIK